MTRDKGDLPFRLAPVIHELTEHERVLIGYWRDLTAGSDPAPDLAMVQTMRCWWMTP